MKKILVTQRIEEVNTYKEIRDCLDTNWALFMNKLDYLPILLPSNFDFKRYFNEIKIDGILITGGNDLFIISNKEIDKKRDLLEKETIDYAIKNDIPLLGVCRGMQIIGNYFNQSIEQVKNHVSVNHPIIISRESKYFKASSISTQKKVVNSYHNYGFKNISEDFLVAAKSDDSSIESIEHKNYKIYAIMWHPERNKDFDKDDISYIKSIFG